MNRTFPALAVASVLLLSAPARAAEGPTIRLAPAEKDVPARIEISGLDKAALDAARKLGADDKHWEDFVKVQVADDEKGRVPPERPALLGHWRVEGDKLRFEPRFPLQQGLSYRVSFLLSGLTGPAANDMPMSVTVSIPKPPAQPATVVSAVYPSSDRLPENQLKFYIHFSAPMARGGIYEHIRLLNDNGKPVFQPFLEVDEELWDATGKRITLLVDPGRIKHGLKPREEFGPVLENGKHYTLVIKTTWNDAAGEPLKAEFRKTFTAGPAEETPPDPKTWKLTPPAAGKDAVTLRFPKPMDHALLHRAIVVRDAGGAEVDGDGSVSDEERTWQFRPTKNWPAGNYRVEVDTILEDRAGNGVGRPFEVDVFRPATKLTESKKVDLRFAIAGSPASK
jgi:Bacterial Ig-like domain